jgi:hypothetical protein
LSIVVRGGLEDPDLVAGALGQVPPVHQDLVEDLGRLELARASAGTIAMIGSKISVSQRLAAIAAVLAARGS